MGTVDVAIVGAGIVGTAAAALLAAEGATVAVFERDAVAAGASGRNSGIVQHPLTAPLAPLHAPSLAAYRELAAALPEHFALEAQPAGLLMLGDDAAPLDAAAGELRAAFPELEPELVDAAAHDPALTPGLAGCLVRTAFPVAPASATGAFAEQARRAGARIAVGAEARVLVRGGRATGVAAGGETVAAGAVLVAAGPWTPEVVDPSGAWRPIAPLWGVTAQVRLPADTPPPRAAIEEAGVEDIADGADAGTPQPLFSLVTARAPGDAAPATVLGSTFTEQQPPDPAAIVPALLERGARFVPALARAEVVAVRCCARPVSRDGAPLLGPVPGTEGLHVAAGHGPWGISLGPASARIAVDALLGRGAVPPAYSAGRMAR